jgi:hypothetical protein
VRLDHHGPIGGGGLAGDVADERQWRGRGGGAVAAWILARSEAELRNATVGAPEDPRGGARVVGQH